MKLKQGFFVCKMYQASNVYFICGFAAIGGALFGFDISSMSGVLGTQAYARYFDHPQSYTQGAITASMPAGSLVGSLCSSFIADRFSRKIALQVSCILWVIGSIIQCASVDRGMLCAGRVIGGMLKRGSMARPAPNFPVPLLTGP